MGGGPARIYPNANHTTQWWESAFARGTFSRIEKILLHTTETTGWPGYKAGASAPTLTYHPRQRAWRQHNYLDTSARALVDPTGRDVRTNRDNVNTEERRVGKKRGSTCRSRGTRVNKKKKQ